MGKITSDNDYLDFDKEVFNYLNQNYYRIVFNLEDWLRSLSTSRGSACGLFPYIGQAKESEIQVRKANLQVFHKWYVD